MTTMGGRLRMNECHRTSTVDDVHGEKGAVALMPWCIYVQNKNMYRKLPRWICYFDVNKLTLYIAM